MRCYCTLQSFAASRPRILGRFPRGGSSSRDTKKETQVTGENLAWELGRRDVGVFAPAGVWESPRLVEESPGVVCGVEGWGREKDDVL